MKLICGFNGTHLIPSSDDSVEAWGKLKSGHEYTVEVKKARNPKFHRMAFGLINAMFDNQQRFESFEDFRRELKILTGHYDEYLTAKGETVYIPRSWAFSQMDELEFEEVYAAIAGIATRRFGHEFVAKIEGGV